MKALENTYLFALSGIQSFVKGKHKFHYGHYQTINRNEMEMFNLISQKQSV